MDVIALSFFYMVFQANPTTSRVSYWKDGNVTKQTMSRDSFLELALRINEGLVYSKVYDACNTYSFFMWDAIDNKVFQLFQKIEGTDNFKYKDSIMGEINKVKLDTSYSTQENIEKNKYKKDNNNIEGFAILEQLGFEQPSFDMVPLLVTTLNQTINKDAWYDKIKKVFKH